MAIGFDAQGREIPDSVPMEAPIGWNRPPTIQEMVQRYIRIEMSKQAAAEGQETFEEADDFDWDEEEPLSPYELQMMQEEARAADASTLEAREPPSTGGDQPVDTKEQTPPPAKPTAEAGVPPA